MAQQFRVVLLDYYDNVIAVKMESQVFEGDSKWDRDFSEATYNELLDLDSEYNLNDYDNVPFMEFQRRVADKNGNWGEWKYLSDPVIDWHNI